MKARTILEEFVILWAAPDVTAPTRFFPALQELMPIHFHCPCGQSFTVPDSRTGQKAVCSSCRQELQVPAADQSMVAALPPKRRRRKQRSRPQLSKSNPKGERNMTAGAEMLPVVVVLIALCLLYHGHVVLRYGIWQPITGLLQSAVIGTATDSSPDSSPDSSMTQPEAGMSVTRWLAQCLSGLGHFSAAVSMAGLLFWQRHAVTGAVVSATLLLLAWPLTAAPDNTPFVYAVAVAAIIILLQRHNAAAWARLMSDQPHVPGE